MNTVQVQNRPVKRKSRSPYQHSAEETQIKKINLPSMAGEHTSKMRLGKEFFEQNCDILAKKMLGKVLCRRLFLNSPGEPRLQQKPPEVILKGRIVETEMYPGVTDNASHSYNGKRTSRNGAMFMAPGTAYVYNIYGMYQCMNISSLETGGCVLLRAIEPTNGLECMRHKRISNRKKLVNKIMKDKELCSGPSKLCQAFDITKNVFNGVDLSSSDSELWLEFDENDIPDSEIVTSTRIGIESAGEVAAKKPYRFYERSNAHVSVRDKLLE